MLSATKASACKRRREMKAAPDLSVAGRFITQDLDGYTRGVLATVRGPSNRGNHHASLKLNWVQPSSS
jgi:hypothetical protein